MERAEADGPERQGAQGPHRLHQEQWQESARCLASSAGNSGRAVVLSHWSRREACLPAPDAERLQHAEAAGEASRAGELLAA
jgi:hypothetical protein